MSIDVNGEPSKRDEANRDWPFVSVIIPCRDEEAYVDACLHAVTREQDYPGQMEVIIAEGRSIDGTREKLRAWTEGDVRIRVVDNPEGIVPTGLNRCIAIARGDVVIRADVHSKYAADYIRETVSVLLETGADNVGGAARPVGDGWVQRAFARAVSSPLTLGGARSRSADFEGWVDTVQYGCWWKSIFEKVGLFDEELVRNQDDEWNLRLTLAGGRVWQSRRIVSYLYPRDSLKRLFSQYFQYGFWKVRVIRKHGKPASARHLVPAAFACLVAALLVAGIWHPAAAMAALTLVGAQLVALTIEAARVAAPDGFRAVLACMVVMGCIHWAYAAGFVAGSSRELLRALARARRGTARAG